MGVATTNTENLTLPNTNSDTNLSESYPSSDGVSLVSQQSIVASDKHNQSSPTSDVNRPFDTAPNIKQVFDGISNSITRTSNGTSSTAQQEVHSSTRPASYNGELRNISFVSPQEFYSRTDNGQTGNSPNQAKQSDSLNQNLPLNDRRPPVVSYREVTGNEPKQTVAKNTSENTPDAQNFVPGQTGASILTLILRKQVPLNATTLLSKQIQNERKFADSSISSNEQRNANQPYTVLSLEGLQPNSQLQESDLFMPTKSRYTLAQLGNRIHGFEAVENSHQDNNVSRPDLNPTSASRPTNPTQPDVVISTRDNYLPLISGLKAFFPTDVEMRNALSTDQLYKSTNEQLYSANSDQLYQATNGQAYLSTSDNLYISASEGLQPANDKSLNSVLRYPTPQTESTSFTALPAQKPTTLQDFLGSFSLLRNQHPTGHPKNSTGTMRSSSNSNPNTNSLNYSKQEPTLHQILSRIHSQPNATTKPSNNNTDMRSKATITRPRFDPHPALHHCNFQCVYYREPPTPDNAWFDPLKLNLREASRTINKHERTIPSETANFPHTVSEATPHQISQSSTPNNLNILPV